jgi:flagellin-specific chaperone FliS
MEFDQLNVNDPKEFFTELVKKALTEDNSKFEFIRNLEMLHVAKFYRSSIRKVIKIFKDLVKGLTKEYADQISDDKQSLDVIMAIKQFDACLAYYKKELRIAKDMISEYKTYVFSGHILNTLFGGYRPDYECVDYRKLPLF